jgi:hypothetical protein
MASALSPRDLRVQIIRTQAISDATPQIGVASSSSRVSPTFVVPVARRPDAGGSGVLLVGAREQGAWGIGDAARTLSCQNDPARIRGWGQRSRHFVRTTMSDFKGL